MEQWVAIINQVGFPIFVTCWFLFRSDRRDEEMLRLIHILVNEKKDGEK